MSSVHPTRPYYHLHRLVIECPPYIQHDSIVLNSSFITYTDILSSVLRTSNTSPLSWTLQLSLTPIYSQVSSTHPTQLYCLELFNYHLHRFRFKCPPYIQHVRILITYTDLQSSVLRTSNTILLSWTLHLSLTPIYCQVSSVHPTRPYSYHLHRFIVKCPPHIQHNSIVLNSIITYTDL